jgi:starch phosphorylase
MLRSAQAAAGVYRYRVAVPGTRPASDYTPRLIPYFEGAAVPLESARIMWQR